MQVLIYQQLFLVSSLSEVELSGEVLPVSRVSTGGLGRVWERWELQAQRWKHPGPLWRGLDSTGSLRANLALYMQFRKAPSNCE